jgi:hypothetical protein
MCEPGGRREEADKGSELTAILIVMQIFTH